MKHQHSDRLKPKVHLVHFYSRPAGIEVLLPGCIKGMAGFEISAFVIRPPSPGDPDIYSSSEISVTYGSRSNLGALLRLFFYSKHNREHIFNVYNIGPLFLLSLRLSGVRKLVYSIHGTKHWKQNWKGLIIKAIWQVALKRSYKIVANSEFSKKTFLQKVNSNASIQVLYNPIDGHRFTPPEHRNTDEVLKIIYVGRLSKGKNIDLWIEMAVKLHKTFKEARFEIYGDGPLYSVLNAKLSSMKADGYVFLKAFRADIENIYRKADILLFLSEYESFGNVVVESILCGTPVIVSDIPSMREIFRDFPEFIVQTDNNLEDNIINKIKEREKLIELSKKAREQFLVRFSEEAHLTALGRIYESFHD